MNRYSIDPNNPGPAEIAERMRQDEGKITMLVHGSHVHATVRLRRWWSFLMNWAPTDRQFQRMGDALRRTCGICDFWLKVAVITCVFYLACEILPAFLPGGPANQVLRGAR